MSRSTVYLSLIPVNTIMGVSQKFFTLEISFIFIILFLKIYWFFLLVPLIHRFMKYIFKLDEMYLEIYRNYANELDFWDPWI
jgi:hypothetical protein